MAPSQYTRTVEPEVTVRDAGGAEALSHDMALNEMLIKRNLSNTDQTYALSPKSEGKL